MISSVITTGEPVATAPPGRVCAAGGCNTVLSVYNHSPYCSVHDTFDWFDELFPKRSHHSGGAHEARLDGSPKRCSHCGRIKPRVLQYWRKDKQASDGLHSWCRECHHADCRARRQRGLGAVVKAQHDIERRCNRKLIPDEVEEIRQSDESQRKLAKRYGISQPEVCKIRTGKKWTRMEEP